MKKNANKKNSVAKNYVYNLIYQLLTILTPLITTPYIARVLGAKNNGIYGYTMSIVTYFVLLGSLGITMYGQREIAYVQDDKNKQTKIFWELVIIKLFTYLISITCFFFIFCLNGEYALYYKILIIEMLANLVDISWYFQGIEDFQKTVIRNLIVKTLGIILIFVFVKTRSDLWIFFMVYVLSNLIGNLSLWLYIPKYLNKKIGKLKFRPHIKPIILLFLPQVAVQIYVVLDKTMVGKITHNMVEVGYYDQSQKIVKALLLIVSALGAVMCSRIANSFAKKKYDEIKEYMRNSVNMVLLISIPLIFGIFAISKDLVPIYFGKEYLPVIPLMNIASFILLAIGLNNVTGVQYLVQVGKQKIFTISVTVGALINVVFNLILINIFGTIGAMYSSVLAEFSILFIQLYFSRNYINVGYILKSSIKYLISGIFMFFLIYLFSNCFKNSIIILGIECFIGIISYFTMLVILRDKFFINLVRQIKNFIFSKIKVGVAK